MNEKTKQQSLKDFLKDKYVYIVTFALAVMIMIGAWIVGEVGPFGGRCLVVVDGVHQYLPFFSEYQHKLQTLDTLQYTMNVGMGNNFLSLWSYYLSSPFNLIIMLCSKQHLPMALNIIITIKIIMAAMCFAYYLMHAGKKPVKNPGIIAFSLFYAFSNYVIGYYWNLMWLDCIFIFPIIILGMEKMLEKKDSRMYILALLYSFICNYYISFMICIFLVLWFFTYSFDGVKDFFVKGFRFAVASLTTAAMSAVVLLPAYMGIMTTASAEFGLPDFNLYGAFADTLRSHLFCSEVMTNQVTDAGTNLYCGIFTLFLAIMFFFLIKDKKHEQWEAVSLKKKIKYALLLLLFVISFNEERLNYIWHGFHNQYGIPNRFAFIYIFVLLIMAYEVYLKREQLRIPVIAAAYTIAMIFVIFCYNHAEVTYDKNVYLASGLILTLYLILFIIFRELKKNRFIIELIIIVFAIIEVSVNGIYAFNEVGSSDPGFYYGDTKTFLKLKERIEGKDNFYRSDILEPLMVDEATWYNLKSVGIFGSTVRGEMVSIMGDLGFYTGANEYLYYGATPVTNALFGVQNVYTREGDFVNLDMELVDKEDHISAYKNNYVLPIAYIVEDRVIDYDTDSNGPFTVQNELCGALAGVEPIFTTIYDSMQTETYGTNLEVTLKDENNVSYSKANSSARADMVFTIPYDMDLYVNCRGTNVNKIALLIDGNEVAYDRYQGQIFHVGKVKQNQLVDIQFALNDDKNKSGELYCYPMEFDAGQFQKFYNVLADQSLQVTEFGSRKIVGRISSDRDAVLMTSLPYDDGWTIYEDGKEIDSYPVVEGFLAGDISKGDHEIRLVYRCPGLLRGFIISIIGVIVFCIICSFEKGKPHLSVFINEKDKQGGNVNE